MANVGSQVELATTQRTVISFWIVQVEPTTLLTSQSVVTDEASGRKYKIQGEVARRPDDRPVFQAAAARLISDMQA